MKTEISMKASGLWTKRMDLGSRYSRMGISMMECGRMAKCMDQENIPSTLEICMKDNLKKT
jgi:hypothetical protein